MYIVYMFYRRYIRWLFPYMRAQISPFVYRNTEERWKQMGVYEYVALL